MAIKFEKIIAGAMLWDVRKATGMQRHNSKWQSWQVRVIEINSVDREVLASWNGNAAQWYSERNATKWRANHPDKKR